MKQEYIDAIEKRLAWQKWMQSPGHADFWFREYHGAPRWDYKAILEEGALYVMMPEFCRMVEGARNRAPGLLAFENAWVLSDTGFVWFAEPFKLPLLKPIEKIEAEARGLIAEIDNQRIKRDILIAEHEAKMAASDDPVVLADAEAFFQTTLTEVDAEIARLKKARDSIRGMRIDVHAMGWRKAPAQIVSGGLHQPDYIVTMFADMRKAGPSVVHHEYFAPLSHFGVVDGQRLGPRVESFEEWAAEGYTKRGVGQADAPYDDPEGMWRHEIRLAYTVFYLMAQKLTVIPRAETDRPTRRRAERNKQTAPPFVHVITLRRLEADRKREGGDRNVDWQWQWEVTGHWRNQFYPGEGVHKQIFIETYIKGPADKPFKDPGVKLFAARR